MKYDQLDSLIRNRMTSPFVVLVMAAIVIWYGLTAVMALYPAFSFMKISHTVLAVAIILGGTVLVTLHILHFVWTVAICRSHDVW